VPGPESPRPMDDLTATQLRQWQQAPIRLHHAATRFQPDGDSDCAGISSSGTLRFPEKQTLNPGKSQQPRRFDWLKNRQTLLEFRLFDRKLYHGRKIIQIDLISRATYHRLQ
jgi:hypothetical protein